MAARAFPLRFSAAAAVAGAHRRLRVSCAAHSRWFCSLPRSSLGIPQSVSVRWPAGCASQMSAPLHCGCHSTISPRTHFARSCGTLAPTGDQQVVTRRGQPINSAITRSLAPPNEPWVQLPPEHAEELDELYQALMEPLDTRPRSQADKVRRMRRVNTDEAVFFARNEKSTSSYAFLIRCLGIQGKLARAKMAFEQMQEEGHKPDGNLFAALMDACARAGDIESAEETLKANLKAGLHLTPPMFTGLVQTFRRAGLPAEEWEAEVLQAVRKRGVVEDAPLHTAIICAHVKERKPALAWATYDTMRMNGVRPDAVTYTALMMACTLGDQLEQADKLLGDMKIMRVEPTLATYNAYINVCSARCRSLAQLAKYKERKRYLQRLAIDVDPLTPLRTAFAQLSRLDDEGFAPDRHTYAALMRACANAGEVERAQNLMSRMLDLDVKPHYVHFHVLLKACARGQTIKDNTHHDSHIQVALAVPPSMEAIGLRVMPQTIDLVLETHTKGLRIYRAITVLEELYAHHGHQPTQRAFNLMLEMGIKMKRPKFVREIITAMHQHGYETPHYQEQKIADLEDTPTYSAHPPLKKAAWSRSRGHHIPQLSDASETAWRRTRKPYVETGRPGRAPGDGPLYLSPQTLGSSIGYTAQESVIPDDPASSVDTAALT